MQITPETVLVSEQTLRFNLLSNILSEFSTVPKEFALKEFFNWDDTKIKECMKLYRKELRQKLKTRNTLHKSFGIAASNDIVLEGGCCGGTCS
jgi:hypothetical protein